MNIHEKYNTKKESGLVYWLNSELETTIRHLLFICRLIGSLAHIYTICGKIDEEI